jgi:NTP pyrophosphatase (non-canonical NTP hydrolase)
MTNNNDTSKGLFYLYHIPGKKIGVTRNLKNRVEAMQGYKPEEYQVLFATTDVDQISDLEIQLQKVFGYKVDMNKYKDVINKKQPMKLNVTEQTTTFPVPKSKLKGRLMDMLDQEWETSLGTFKLTKEAINWIEHNAVTSMFDKERSFIYNKAFYEAFIAEEAYESSEDLKSSIFDHIRQWAKNRGIYEKGDPKTQLIKLYEESGELSQAILKDDKEGIIDAIGDSVVVLTNLAELVGTDIETCIAAAYAEISSRTGRMINGTFVKDQL